MNNGLHEQMFHECSAITTHLFLSRGSHAGGLPHAQSHIAISSTLLLQDEVVNGIVVAKRHVTFHNWLVSMD